MDDLAAVTAERDALKAPPAPERSKGGGGSNGTGGVHSAIVGLLRDLPPPGTEWPKRQKDRFVKAFEATLDFIYPTDDERGDLAVVRAEQEGP